MTFLVVPDGMAVCAPNNTFSYFGLNEGQRVVLHPAEVTDLFASHVIKLKRRRMTLISTVNAAIRKFVFGKPRSRFGKTTLQGRLYRLRIPIAIGARFSVLRRVFLGVTESPTSGLFSALRSPFFVGKDETLSAGFGFSLLRLSTFRARCFSGHRPSLSYRELYQRRGPLGPRGGGNG